MILSILIDATTGNRNTASNYTNDFKGKTERAAMSLKASPAGR